MKPNLLLALALLSAGSISAAEVSATNQVKDAITKLKGQTNYSWSAKLEMPGMPFTPSPMQGQTEKNGFTLITQEFGDNKLQAVIKGDKAVVQVEDGWEVVGAPDSGDGANPAAMIGFWLTRNKTAAFEAESLVAKAKELKTGDSGLLSSDLSEDGAKDLLSFGPRGAGAPAPKNAKGSVKFWLKDGALTKFESHVTGTAAFGPDQEERDIDMTRTVEVREINTTKVDAPTDAKKKLEAK